MGVMLSSAMQHLYRCRNIAAETAEQDQPRKVARCRGRVGIVFGVQVSILKQAMAAAIQALVSSLGAR
ncbi:hypothetical protein A9Q89_02815 [Gammaproteobacteria bacterium 53_120_T64]|nr:hypothetical protein A9Q89_02815 [Gammaproteobacteria bacterium 53_120_T64]